jgi:hypothetical protein
MAARQHHYVPQCYLKGFARDRRRSQLHVFDFIDQKAFTAHTKNIAQERDFHTLESEDLPADAMERAFSGFESEVSAALARISAAGSLADETDVSYLMNLMALTAVKNPRNRAAFAQFRERILKTAMRVAVSTPEIWERQVRQAKAAGFIEPNVDTSYSKMRHFIETDAYTMETTPHAHLITELDLHDKVLPYFFSRRWSTLRAPADSGGFITSDQPVCLMWRDPIPADRRRMPPGHGVHRTVVLFPISWRVAVVGAFEGDERELDVDGAMVADFNALMIEHCRRQVYSRDAHFAFSDGDFDNIRAGPLFRALTLTPTGLRRKAPGSR